MIYIYIYIYIRERGRKRGGRFFLIEGGDSFWSSTHWRIGRVSLRNSTQEREKGDCSQDCLGTLLVTLGVFIHIQSLHLVVYENSMYC